MSIEINQGINLNRLQTSKVQAGVANNQEGRSFSSLLAAASQPQEMPGATAKQQPHALMAGNDYRAHLGKIASTDAAQAKELLATHTSADYGSMPLIDISNWPTVRYSVSGELQTPESEAYFAQVATSARQARADLVQTERQKGTSDAAILDQVLAFNSNLPPRYKDMANIFY